MEIAKKYNKSIIAASYSRVSTEKQGNEGYSIESQTENAEKYAERNGLKLLDEFKFIEERPATYVKGHEKSEYSIIESFRDRPQFAELLSKAQNKEFSHLIVYSRDRISRVVEDSMALELFFARFKIKVHYIKEGDDFGNSSPKIRRLLHIIFASLAEMEVSLLSSRVKEGGKACIKKGRWAGGKVPFGYTPHKVENDLMSSKKRYTKLQVSDFESKMVKRVYELYSLGYGYRSVAEKMNYEYGFIKWTKSKIEGIIKNQTYTGKMFYDRRGGRRNSKKHTAPFITSPFEADNVIIDNNLWDEVSKTRTERNLNNNAHYYTTNYILSGKLKCSKCERMMKVKNPGKNRPPVYHCANGKDAREECNVIIPCELAEKSFIEYMQKDIFNVDNMDKLWDIYDIEFDNRIKEYKNMKDEINKRINELRELLDKMSIFLESRKNDDNLRSAVELQYSIYNNLLSKYDEAYKMLDNKANTPKKSKQELSILVKDFIPALFINIDSKELTRLRREFIIQFVDSIAMSYNKKTKKINIEKIVFLPPELM